MASTDPIADVLALVSKRGEQGCTGFVAASEFVREYEVWTTEKLPLMRFERIAEFVGKGSLSAHVKRCDDATALG